MWLLLIKFCNWRRDRLLLAETRWSALVDALIRRMRVAELRRRRLVK